MSKECLVIPRKQLEKVGFIPQIIEGNYSYIKINSIGKLKSFLQVTKISGLYKERSGKNNIENNPHFQQLIMYGFVVRQDGKFLLYQRGGGENYSENRLAGKVSVGIGGHIEPTDLGIAESFYREFEEEAEIFKDDNPISLRDRKGNLNVRLMKKYVSITPIGFLKDERDEVGRVHFGVVCKITPRVKGVEVRIRTGDGQENIRTKYITPEEYMTMKSSDQIIPEGWTDIVFRKEIKDQLKNKSNLL